MSLPAQFLPWQQDDALRWLNERERFAHAWLIHGLAGIGKRSFALAAAAALLCEEAKGGAACGQCQACLWMASGNHPDFRRVRPDAVALAEGEQSEESAAQAQKSPSKEIRVEQMRALSGWFNTATHRGGWRVAVIYPAQAMNLITANALLKVLEEPPPRTVFLLTTDAPDRLLPTIVSRCRRLPLAVPSRDQAIAWLQEKGVKGPDEWLAAAGGAPVRALHLSKSGDEACPNWLQNFMRVLATENNASASAHWMATADELETMEPASWLDALQRLFIDISFVAAGAAPRYYPAQRETLARVAGKSDPVELSDTAKWLAGQRAIAAHPLSAKLFIHSVLQRCANACSSTTRTE